MKSICKSLKVLIVDDELEYREVYSMILEEEGYLIDSADSGEEALNKLKKEKYDLVLTDLIMDGMSGIELLKEIKKKFEATAVIIFTGYGTIENAVEAMKQGAVTYFVKGHDPEELVDEINKFRDRVITYKKIEGNTPLDSKFMLTTKSEKFRKTLEIAEKAAKSNINILLLGESGVGKEVFAKHIHKCSERGDESFIAVNCQAYYSGLIESELFGHEKGAFTGADSKRKGVFEIVDRGTLFLDEIGDVALDTQVKLLRILESRSFQRIGSNKLLKTDFRLVTATNKDLNKEIDEGNFREDFFYRISTITIEIPPLRDRKEDLGMFIEFFLNKAQNEHNIRIEKIEEEVMEFLHSYDYPGNVRELKNIIDRLVVLSENGQILKKYLPDIKNSTKVTEYNLEEIRPLKEIRKEIESEYIEKVLEICNGNISEAARKLDISRRQLFNKISEYELR